MTLTIFRRERPSEQQSGKGGGLKVDSILSENAQLALVQCSFHYYLEIHHGLETRLVLLAKAKLDKDALRRR